MKYTIVALALLVLAGCEVRGEFKQEPAPIVKAVHVRPPEYRSLQMEGTLLQNTGNCWFAVHLPSGNALDVDLDASVCEKELPPWTK